MSLYTKEKYAFLEKKLNNIFPRIYFVLSYHDKIKTAEY